MSHHNMENIMTYTDMLVILAFCSGIVFVVILIDAATRP